MAVQDAVPVDPQCHREEWDGLLGPEANYLVLPRSVLQSMPEGWQARFAELLGDLREEFGDLEWPHSYMVVARRANGRFILDPIPPPDHGRTLLVSKREEAERAR